MRPTLSLCLAPLGLGCHTLASPVSLRTSGSGSQKLMTGSKDTATGRRKPLFEYTLKEHDPDAIICKAGSKQYTGAVSMSPERQLSFWFIESRDDPKNSPLTVLLEGGPGGSSMKPLFESIGPCSVNEHSNGTVYENRTWAEFTNLLFVDQPVGVGLSATPGSQYGFVDGIPDNMAEASQDFYNFLLSFFTDLFPQYASNNLHVFGHSFGGIFAPGFVDYINSQRRHSYNAIPEIKSIILDSAWVDGFTSSYLAIFEHNCNPAAPRKFPMFNESICNELEIYAPQCVRSAAICREKLDSETCKHAGSVCGHLRDFINNEVGDGKGLVEVYDDRYTERTRPPFIKPDLKGDYSTLLNNETIRKELGIKHMYLSMDHDVLSEWTKSGEYWIPSTNHLERILDNTDTRVLALNGNNDGLVITQGQKRVYDSLLWRRQASYQMHEFVDWHYPLRLHGAHGRYQDFLVKGGQWKKTDDRTIKNKLAFFTVDEAGHTSTEDQREATTWLVGCWMGMRKRDKRCPV